MKINRHNYEEYFLLYIDNELQQKERNEVDSFIAQNPDLADELSLLQLAILPQANISFDDKELLFKKEEGISLSNYQAFFLLYIDHELTASQAEDVERFVLQHPALQSEFTLTKKSKLEPEYIYFKEKNSLYRKEKARRIIPVAWMRMGIAAAVLALIMFAWIFTRPTFHGSDNMPVSKINHVTGKPQKNVTNPVTNQSPAPLPEKVINDSALVKQKNNIVIPLQKAKFKIREGQLQENVAVRQPAVQNNEINQPKQKVVLPEEPKQTNKEESIAQRPADDKNYKAPYKDEDILKQSRNQTIDGQPALVSNAVYREIDTNDEDRNIYIGSATINKNKIKGLFKKAVRLFGKNNSDSDK